jgi:uncharacterized protein YecE (DUF72 family)
MSTSEKRPTLASIRVGVGGWTFALWRGTFFPAGMPHAQELAYASTQLTSIEINGTFYRHQTPASFAAWRDATPEGFVFAVKAHRATTQSRDLAAAAPAIERFIGGGLEELGPKLGPILWQFAPTTLPATLNGAPLMHAIEARHPSFDDPAWVGLARTYGVAIAIVDSDKQALRGDITGGFVYARLQRNSADAPEGYDTASLDAWAARLRRWAAGQAVEDLPLAGPPAASRPLACFAYCISGDKERAPDAARALIGRL